MGLDQDQVSTSSSRRKAQARNNASQYGSVAHDSPKKKHIKRDEDQGKGQSPEEESESGQESLNLGAQDYGPPEPAHRPRRRSRHASSLGHNSDADSVNSHDREMTLKDRQDAINKQHPFGLPLWKPALYKKSRSVVRKANRALHSSPSSSSELFLNPGNIVWLLVFGWWLALVMFVISLVLTIIPPNGRIYALVMRELSFYLLWPFGRYVERTVDIKPSAVQGGEYGDEETGLLNQEDSKNNILRTVVEILKSGPAGCVYYFLFVGVIAPLLLLVSTICWMCVITVPMAKLNYILMRHLRRHPLSLRFRSSRSGSQLGVNHQPTVILLCTYQAFGLQYYKYTYDGINIIFINLLSLVFFVIFDEYVLKEHWPDATVTSPSVVFALSLGSVIPLSYFIGMGVSSVSAQSSMGVGAVINATFGSIIEIILYAVALMRGKSSLVEGSLIGSILAGVLLMPGCSMISAGVKRKEQRFNAKSAGVTSTMLIMAIIGALSPTLFYQMFGSYELLCTGCPENDTSGQLGCSRCYFDQMNPLKDPVYENSVKPFMWICAAILPSAYLIGLVFSLHTHVDMVWNTAPSHSQSQSYYQKLLPAHLISQILHPQPHSPGPASESQHATTEHHVPGPHSIRAVPPVAFVHAKEPEEEEEEEAAGHDSPNWSKAKSFTILFACTLLYSIIAEILVDTVDLVMSSVAIDEKFLGLTLFALVPNITEFMNAISFALYGNIVLSMEIGSAYALQVCLLQIPAMVAFSLWFNWGKEEIGRYTFSLIFPRWDVISVIFSVFLLTYTYQEGKANYFKGSILILSYFVLVAGFYYIPPFSNTGILVGFNPLAHSSL
ncbi:Sodium/calcium exchanger protein-domain-containing protein [Phycomyces nitens]|nr:Sodium/calcium exchanger protein-domain-containing protein [Phycomyces nitens]